MRLKPNVTLPRSWFSLYTNTHCHPLLLALYRLHLSQFTPLEVPQTPPHFVFCKGLSPAFRLWTSPSLKDLRFRLQPLLLSAGPWYFPSPKACPPRIENPSRPRRYFFRDCGPFPSAAGHTWRGLSIAAFIPTFIAAFQSPLSNSSAAFEHS